MFTEICHADYFALSGKRSMCVDRRDPVLEIYHWQILKIGKRGNFKMMTVQLEVCNN